jgi:four helix bundle suffix protein
MVQAARSGRQNIAEGSRASATSSQTELRLVNVARASLDELLLDYEDFLRQRNLEQWEKNSPQAREVRAVGNRNQTDRSDPTDPSEHPNLYTRWLEHHDPAVIANTLICLIHQANYLLDRQIAGLESGFIQEGGYSERLAAARIAEREKQNSNLPSQSVATDPSTVKARRVNGPDCPKCGKVMVLRTARKGRRAGTQFWGCSAYPGCQSTLPFKGSDRSV